MAHIICVPGTKKEQIDAFIKDYEKELFVVERLIYN
ncbi:hypothetical protein TASCI_140067 [Tenacibaculum ascidiaceicola]